MRPAFEWALRVLSLTVVLCAGVAAYAQETWVQIEAVSTLSEGEERARAYAGVFPNVSGFQMPTGWYAVVLGPYTPEDASSALGLLRSERLIPGDSYIAATSSYRQRFWPSGTSTAAPTVTEEPTAALPAPAATVLVETETPAEARRSEALLNREERMLVQEALQWYGFYTAAIDGDFGPGTRKSMAAWQSAQAFESTGILTTLQRRDIIAEYQAERAALGLETYTEAEAGIEISLPTALVSFERYEPPFVHFKEKDGSGFRVLLISQQGEPATLFGLYDLMQTLEIVPLNGERALGRTSFELNGQNERIKSYTYAELKSGLIKGFTLVWEPQHDARATRVLEAMKSSFRPTGDQALSDGLGVALAEDRADLLAGLEIRRPTLSRSGFYLDASGTVATTDEVLAQCGRVTIDGSHEMDVVLQDSSLGLAILKPREALAPRTFASLRTGPARLNSEVAVAGYSYEDALNEAVLSFGTLADLKGLNGETGLARLTVSTLSGDAGGPVLDTSGKVMGMLLPRSTTNGRVLPDDVGFALQSEVISMALADHGMVEAQQASAEEGTNGTLAAEDLTMIGRDMTVLVSCWQ
jgi:peptidoglycan hydrolase-like protein with peptidoglycan-binding domain